MCSSTPLQTQASAAAVSPTAYSTESRYNCDKNLYLYIKRMKPYPARAKALPCVIYPPGSARKQRTQLATSLYDRSTRRGTKPIARHRKYPGIEP